METRFEVVAAATQDGYRVLNESLLKKHKVSTVYLVMMIASGIVAIFSAFSMSIGTMLVELIFCIVISVLYAVMPKLQGNASWKARNTALDISPITYRFDDSYMYINHPLTAETSDYRLLTDVVETDAYFLLHINKHSAYVLPKQAFTAGTPDEFRSFLMHKLGRPLTAYSEKKQRTNRILWAVLVPVLAAVLCVFFGAMGMVDHTVTTTSVDGRESLSIDVPLYLTWDDYEDGYNYLYSDDVSILIEYEDNDYLREILSVDEVTREAYAQYLIDSGYVDSRGTWAEEEDGALVMSYDYDSFYYCSYIFWTGEDCFLVEFSCSGEDEFFYAEDFAKWRASIVVEVDE